MKKLKEETEKESQKVTIGIEEKFAESMNKKSFFFFPQINEKQEVCKKEMRDCRDTG